jgi:hypothetical protein
MRMITTGMLALCLGAGIAQAEPMTLSGAIGGKPVFFEVNRNGDTVSGWYFTLKSGKQIRLEGKIDRRGFFDMQEYSASTNTPTGSLSGRIKDGHWAGRWKSVGGKTPRPLALDPLKDTVKAADGHYRCTARRNSDDTTMSHSVDLTLAKGRVTGLTLSRNQRSGEEAPQRCTLAGRDLKQMPSRSGILLRARRDGAHCTLRILGTGDYLVLRPGQTNQAGDDCRGAGPSHFCTPGAFWSDLIVNRKTGRCVSVE